MANFSQFNYDASFVNTWEIFTNDFLKSIDIKEPEYDLISKELMETNGKVGNLKKSILAFETTSDVSFNERTHQQLLTQLKRLNEQMKQFNVDYKEKLIDILPSDPKPKDLSHQKEIFEGLQVKLQTFLEMKRNWNQLNLVKADIEKLLVFIKDDTWSQLKEESLPIKELLDLLEQIQ